MSRAVVRVYVQAISLQEIHDKIAELEAKGWRKDGNLLYTATESEMGWELAMARDVEDYQRDGRSHLFDLWPLVACGLLASVLSVVIWLYT